MARNKIVILFKYIEGLPLVQFSGSHRLKPNKIFSLILIRRNLEKVKRNFQLALTGILTPRAELYRNALEIGNACLCCVTQYVWRIETIHYTTQYMNPITIKISGFYSHIHVLLFQLCPLLQQQYFSLYLTPKYDRQARK